MRSDQDRDTAHGPSGKRKPARRWTLALAGLAALAVLGVALWHGRYAILQWTADAWAVSDPIARSDVAVVLGGGLETRPFAAARLFRMGLVRRVVISRVSDPVGKAGVAERHLDLNRGVLVRMGVPASAIETFGRANDSTEDEAVTLAAWASTDGARSFIIPTEVFSARRVRWTFRRRLHDIGGRVAVLPVESREYQLKGWWLRNHGVLAFRNELMKYFYYRLRY